jgi:hypothetical protein
MSKRKEPRKPVVTEGQIAALIYIDAYGKLPQEDREHDREIQALWMAKDAWVRRDVESGKWKLTTSGRIAMNTESS